ncbi:metal-dependent hydrolase [Herbidospora daliensis]|uniref:metal-dependent hydrolase n=1 Tax=Herbidospora daliensis TaxID=295585 RepID=UPI000A001058|nr:metal-dependent hydrolase [Herbidospora daliensis]
MARTPFHPLDHAWPDQPADTGLLAGARVVDCQTGATDGQTLYIGDEIPVKRGAEGWHWLVVHIMEEPIEGQVELWVDPDRRHGLSAGHTACHLTALALNEALAPLWRKEARTDSLGHPDFDQLAITSSRILNHGSRDVYRLGKSLRRKGFDPAGLDLAATTEQVGERLKEWIAADAPVWVDCPDEELTARRTWRCLLPGAEASIPCGGTHLTSTGELNAVAVEFALDGDELAMTTRVARR